MKWRHSPTATVPSEQAQQSLCEWARPSARVLADLVPALDSFAEAVPGSGSYATALSRALRATRVVAATLEARSAEVPDVCVAEAALLLGTIEQLADLLSAARMDACSPDACVAAARTCSALLPLGE